MDPTPDTKAQDQKTTRARRGTTPWRPQPPTTQQPSTPQCQHPCPTATTHPPKWAAGPTAPVQGPRTMAELASEQRYSVALKAEQEMADGRLPWEAAATAYPANPPPPSDPDSKFPAEGKVQRREWATYTGPTGPLAQHQTQQRHHRIHETRGGGQTRRSTESPGEEETNRGDRGPGSRRWTGHAAQWSPNQGRHNIGPWSSRGSHGAIGRQVGPTNPEGEAGVWRATYIRAPGRGITPHTPRPDSGPQPTDGRADRPNVKRNDGRPVTPPSPPPPLPIGPKAPQCGSGAPTSGPTSPPRHRGAPMPRKGGA
ncbi:translation initiation factor IF-2-like [Thalassophryne amazonica]|uniref:translation initiation factor IF-2-like n=1 Tax=Thalassophryne amazonica TaxID=390379 RepID=UPI001471ACB9|nr:translation initiation factor IF-2-like [Thalassophryne amazonica]